MSFAGPGGAAPATQHSKLYDAISSYVAHRHGSVTVAVYDRIAKRWTLFHRNHRMHTASIVKADILSTLLHRERGSLTASQKSLARRMIEQSDNSAATKLWHEVDGHAGVEKYDKVAGLTQTAPDRYGYWGLTTTSALDQVRLVQRLLNPSDLLTDAARRYQRTLMRHVTSSQRWGISAGPSGHAAYGLKNGWLPVSSDNGRWVVNSIGWVRGDHRNYAIAVLTAHESSMRYGITTIEHISRLVWTRTGHSTGS